MNQPVSSPIPTKTRFEPATTEVTGPSGRKYRLRELNALQQAQADSVATGLTESMYFRTGMAIDAIDDEPIVTPATKAMLTVLLSSISGPDADVLVMAYANAFNPKADDIKNELTPVE